MGQKKGATLTQQAVDGAAGKLLAKGIRPTVQLVHEALGGSPKGLRAMLEDWRIRLASRAPEGSATGPALPEERAEQLVRQALDEVRGSLRERIRNTRKRLNSLTSAAIERAEASGRLTVNALELSEVEAEFREFQSHLTGCIQRIGELNAQLLSAEKRSSNLLKRIRDLRKVRPVAAPRGRDKV